MAEKLILSACWSEYDAYKLNKNEDPLNFMPGDVFEANFLVQKILEHYPQYTEMTIRLSLSNVQRLLYGGCKRNVFVKLVVGNLLQRKPLITS